MSKPSGVKSTLVHKFPEVMCICRLICLLGGYFGRVQMGELG